MLQKISLFFAAVLLTAGCVGPNDNQNTPPGDDDDAVPSAAETVVDETPTTRSQSYNYSGPGSFYETALNADGTFSVTRYPAIGSDMDFTATGQYRKTDDGFIVMRVQNVDPEDSDKIAVGDRAFALEVPGFALMLKPLTGHELIPMLASDDCPTEDFAANWVTAQSAERRSAADPERDWFGTFAYAAAAGGEPATGTLPAKYNLVGPAEIAAPAETMDASQCTDGLLQIRNPDGGGANMWLTAHGAIVETHDSDGDRGSTIFGMRAQPREISELAGTYAALLIRGAPRDSEAGASDAIATRVRAAVVELDEIGMGTGIRLTNIPRGTRGGGEGIQFDLNTAGDPGPGWVTGTLTKTADPGASGNLACTSYQDAAQGSTVLFCTGQHPEHNRRPFTMVLVSTP